MRSIAGFLLLAQQQQPTRLLSPFSCRVVQDEQPAWTDGMATIQALMGRVQQQLQAVSNLRPNNPALARELKAKAESHLELLMSLAESQHEQHIQGSSSSMNSSSRNTSDLQQVLHELQVQLDLEQQAALTAASKGAATNSSSTAPPQQQQPGRRRRTSSSSRAPSTAAAAGTGSDGKSSSSSDAPSNGSAAAALQQQLQQAQAAAAAAQERLAAAEAQVATLQQQLADTKSKLQGSSEELSEHRELQMAYDRQCQDLYRLRMQLQLVRTQGNDTASLAAAANKQHKQVLVRGTVLA
jgi:chromosome segregation ATPase